MQKESIYNRMLILDFTEHLPHARDCFTGFICTNSFHSHNKPIREFLLFHLMDEKERFMEAKDFVQSHIAGKWQSQMQKQAIRFQSHRFKLCAILPCKATWKGKQR